jgi:hypothetical protein
MGSAVIFSGTKVKTLKSTIDLGGGNDIISSTVDPTSSATSANPGSLLLNSSTGKLYRKNDSGSSTNWTEVGASGQAGINYILNPDAANGTTGWSTYKETDSVTFQDTGDTVTLNSHGIEAGTAISFTSITSTTGISTNTLYYVVNPTTNTFQVATSVGGSALALTTNGSGTMVRSIPKTGSGGSPNITWTRDTTTPLRGSADFNFTKGAANYMGEGVAYSFTIDNADIAKPLSVTFDYELLSGTYTTGDLTVYLIADPSGTPVIIQPVGYQIQSATASTKMRHIATFQTQASGTSYRLVVQVATVSASAYTFALDTIAVGPQYASFGCPVTDVVAWRGYTTSTQSITTSFVKVTSWTTLNDTNNAFDTTNSKYVVPVPGYYIVTGSLFFASPGASANTGIAVLYKNGSIVNLGPRTYLPAGNSVAAAYSNTVYCNAGDYLEIYGYAGTVNLTAGSANNDGNWSIERVSGPAQIGATNVVALSVGNGSSTLTLTTSTQVLPFNIVTTDTNGGFSTSTNYYTIPVPGIYTISANILYNVSAFTSSDSISTGIFLSTGTALQYTRTVVSSANFHTGVVTYTGSFTAGQQIYIAAGKVGTGITANFHNDPSYSRFFVNRLSGPTQIAATETVAAIYKTAAADTMTNITFTRLNFVTKVKDTNNSVTTGASWGFVAPISGFYFVTASATVSSTAATATSLRIKAGSSGSEAVVIQAPTLQQTTTSSNETGSICSGMVYMLAGQNLFAEFYQNSGSNRTLVSTAEVNQISIIRVGN